MAKDLENWLGNLYFEDATVTVIGIGTIIQSHIVQIFGWDERI